MLASVPRYSARAANLKVLGNQPLPFVRINGSVKSCEVLRASFHQSLHGPNATPPATSLILHPLSSALLSHYDDTEFVLSPKQKEIRNVEAWAALVEPLLPTLLRKSPVNPAIAEPSKQPRNTPVILAQILLRARNTAGLDVLSHIGLVEKRWECVMWIVQALLATSTGPIFPPHVRALPGLQWPPGYSLNQATQPGFMQTFVQAELILRTPSSPQSSRSSKNPGLDAIAEGVDRTPTTSRNHERDLLGQLWETLGTLILTAVDSEAKDADIIMPKVLRIIASLHHQGYIPDDVYNFTSVSNPRAVQQSPLLNTHASLILSSLSDAVYEHSPTVGVRPPWTIENPFFRVPNTVLRAKSPQLGPELWFEFVLWCCIHGGWLKEGTQILQNMRKYQGKKRWSLVNWRSTHVEPTNMPRSRFSSNASIVGRDASMDEGKKRPVERTISIEVVIAYVDGLLAAISSPEATGYTIPEAVEKITILKSILERDKMSLGVASWDAVVAHFAELPNLTIETNPRITELILQLIEPYGKEAAFTKGSPPGIDTTSSTSYHLDGSVIALSLYHRALLAYIKSRDIDGALRLLSRLQSLTDKNKKQAMEQFFTQMQQKVADERKQAEDYQRKDDNKIRRVESTPVIFEENSHTQLAGFFPEIPLPILARLLDLITESGAYEIGKWMIRSEDIDGPLIPSSQFSNQTIAPALIRFAAVTKDTDLLSQVTRSQPSTISGITLVALCDSRIKEKRWASAMETIALIRDYSLHEWTSQDLSVLLSSLLQHIKEPPNASYDKDAATLLQKMLRGDLGQVWGTKFTELDSLVAVLSDVNPTLAGLCSNLLVDNRLSSIDMSIATFNNILQGVVKSYGSNAGRSLWDNWCDKGRNLRDVKIMNSHGQPLTPRKVLDVSANFSYARSQATGRRGAATFKGCITPDIATIRIILQQALKEARESLPHEEARTEEARTEQASISHYSDVLDWASIVLSRHFDMTETDINYEMQGYKQVSDLASSSSSSSSADPYSRKTLDIWLALSGARRPWTDASEERMRNFASNKLERHVVFDESLAAERRFLHCLAADLGMISESFGDEYERPVTVFKRTLQEPQVAVTRVGDIARRLFNEP